MSEIETIFNRVDKEHRCTSAELETLLETGLGLYITISDSENVSIQRLGMHGKHYLFTHYSGDSGYGNYKHDSAKSAINREINGKTVAQIVDSGAAVAPIYYY